MHRSSLLTCLLVPLLSVTLTAQAPAPDTPGTLFKALMDLEPDPQQGARVTRLVIQRGSGTLELEDGQLWLAKPLAGRVVAAMYVGNGRLRFTAPMAIERAQMERVLGDSILDAPLERVFLLFADSTLVELRRTLAFQPLQPVAGARRLAHDALDYVKPKEDESFAPELMLPILNGATTGMFYAHVDRRGKSPVMLQIDPTSAEPVQLQMRARRLGFMRTVESAAQFGSAAVKTDGADVHATYDVASYAIDATLARSAAGEARFSALTAMTVAATGDAGPWLTFYLAPGIEVDSILLADGKSAPFEKERDGSLLWTKIPAALHAGESLTLRVAYAGDLIDRYGDFFFLKSSSLWYPRPLNLRSKAKFDLTFHTPATYRFATVGTLADSTLSDRVLTTHWVSPRPMRNVSFNIGFFEDYKTGGENGPKVTVLFSDKANKSFGIVSASKAKERVGQDVAQSAAFFTAMFGKLDDEHLYATQIPYGHGEAFPGLIHLSFVTFASTEGRDDFDQFFRAHEVAHQWWGIGVDFASYRDQWLSEGFSNFSGLWYTQIAQKKNKYYFDQLDRWKADLKVRRDVGPVWLGYRTATPADGSEYNLVVYQKGAWTLHMLRILMLDLKTMQEDRFTGLMRDFYQTYKGRAASTADFRRIAEKHAGADLGWFFDQWLTTTQMPEYKVTWSSEPAEGGKYRVRLHVDQRRVPESFLAYVPVTIQLDGGQVARLRVKVQGASTDAELPLMPSKPTGVLFNDLQGVLADVSM